jgi:hypothetical protein
MNFTEREFVPSFRVYDLFHSIVLNSNPDSVVPRNYMYLRKNSVKTEDSLIYPFDYDVDDFFFDVGK